MIYTGAGDCGKSSIAGLSDIPKDDIIFDVLGTIDELAAHLGMARASCTDGLRSDIEKIQDELIDAAAMFAGAKSFDFAHAVKKVEERICSYNPDELCPKKIIKYGATECGARLDAARAVCRRLERTVVSYRKSHSCPEGASAYFNRLSDYLFVIARYTEKGMNLN